MTSTPDAAPKPEAGDATRTTASPAPCAAGPAPDSATPLHRMNPTSRFSDRVEDYVKFRPTYPGAAIDFILGGYHTPPSLIAADIGAGTGISARLLAARGVRVIAIEPNADMRRAAGASTLIEWRSGTAEATGIASSSVDIVLCAQAFHWFRTDEALLEFQRILRRPGRLALMWNQRDAGDPLTSEYTAAIRAASDGHSAERMAFDRQSIPRTGKFQAAILREFRHSQRLTREGLIGRALSASYIPKTGSAHETLLRALDAAFTAHSDADGHVELRYVTQVFLSSPY